jgi:hypothetical protein
MGVPLTSLAHMPSWCAQGQLYLDAVICHINNAIYCVFLFTTVIATIALAFLLLPMCQYVIRPCSDGNK